MFSRTVLSILGILSLSWIVYVTINIAAGSVVPSPENVFTKSDQSIVVVHNTKEIDYDQEAFHFLQETPFYIQLLSKQERIQHYYFSTSREIVVLERSKPWTFDIIQNYFTKLGIGSNLKHSKEVKLTNDWKIKYHDHFLVLFKGEFKPSEQSILDWKFADRKASASIVSKNNSAYQIENCYFISTNNVKYISTGNHHRLPLVDDQDVFQDIVPSDFKHYEFYETNYLKLVQKSNSPLYEWMDQGLIVLETKLGKCIITDFKAGQNPIAVIAPLLDENVDLTTDKRVTLTNLSLPLPQFKSGKYHLEVFNGRAFIASNPQVINSIIGNYETGNTLAQSSIKRFQLFSETPKKCSYRLIDSKEHLTKSYLEKSIHTVIQTLDAESEETEENLISQLAPLRLDGSILQIIPIQGSQQLYVVTNTGTVYYISNERILWSKALNETVVGEPVLIPGSNQLAVQSSSNLHLFNSGGAEAEGFPIAMNQLSATPYHYIWKGEGAVAVINGSNLELITLRGKRVGSVSIGNNSSENTPICIQAIKGELIANVVVNGNWNRYNVKRKQKLKSIAVGEGEWYFVKNNNQVSAVGLSKKQFVRFADNGKKGVLIGNVSKILRRTSTADQELFFLSQQQRIFVVNGTGGLVAQFETRVTNISDVYLSKNRSGKTLVGILDGIANNSYIYTLNGNELSKQQFEGSSKLVLHKRGDNSLVLVSESNNYLVRYPLNY